MGIADWFSGRKNKFGAVENVKAGGKLSKDQDRELARLQLPFVSPDNIALRGMRLEANEVAHYCVLADLYERPESPSGIGVRVNHDAPYIPGSSRGLELPVNGADKTDGGYVIVTNQRFIFKGARTFGHKLAQNQHFFLYEDGLRLPFGRGHLLFLLRAEGQSEVIGTLLTRLKAL
jgi:hypothetical protein